MMRAVDFVYPPKAPVLTFNAGTLSWTDNSLSETAYAIQRSTDNGATWSEVGRITRDLADPNTTGDPESFATVGPGQYRVVAENTVGDTFDYSNPGTNEIPTFPGDTGFPHITATSNSNVVTAA